MPERGPARGGGFGAALAAARRRDGALLRNHGGGRAPVSNLELFFDLVYVFAVTQLSHLLLDHFTGWGAAQTVLMFLAVWWAWMFTTWATNWLDPEKPVNRLAIAAVMLGSLVMACALPRAFTDQGGVFAAAYVAIQLGRSAWLGWAQGEWAGSGSRNMTRVCLWFTVSGVGWLAGALAADPRLRLAWWTLALGIEYLGPLVRFVTPGLGSSRTADWNISGSHMAERTSLFIIIALGEGLVMTGATFAAAPPQPGLGAAFVTAFVLSFAVWWGYFDIGAARGAEHIERHADPGRVAREAFTYWHIPIVAGIVILAVADELALAHPHAPADPAFVAIVCGGIALFVWGTMAFKKISSGRPWYPLSHALGLALIGAAAAWGVALAPARLSLSIAGAGTLIVIAVWEWVSFNGGWIERMEARGWRMGRTLRRVADRRRAVREAKAARG